MLALANVIADHIRDTFPDYYLRRQDQHLWAHLRSDHSTVENIYPYIHLDFSSDKAVYIHVWAEDGPLPRDATTAIDLRAAGSIEHLDAKLATLPGLLNGIDHAG